ncbi:adenylate/guanylate cyclase domain-containing protein [Nocardioides sp. SYSU D00038]|uniref:adenylate/guanylate cyclase domain-containing protein n=1 Tax=Nocardioides sp. SYSU D00038 TaxID=2812554 RepID=UPI00196820EC|nr:adenylate/guanylate cyclase domain-containing protein [Nocardioides sp. SYSU D00038]
MTDPFQEALAEVEGFLLGEPPSLTRVEVCERAGVPLEVAQELWRLLGFPHTDDDLVAFTPADVEALRLSSDLMALGILSPERQAALVRTWGRSFARLAEWQTTLLTDVALESGRDPAAQLTGLTEQVLPRVATLQDYVWRRHLASATSRVMGVASGAGSAVLAVGFVDIVGFTSRSRSLSEVELVAWVEQFEAACTDVVTEHGGRVIKNIGDEVLFVSEDVAAATRAALEMVRRGSDDDDAFPQVRAGVAYGEVVPRLGDVFGPTVNLASRLTSLARPGSVLVERGARDALGGIHPHDDEHEEDDHDHPDRETGEWRFRRLRRAAVKGYSRLEVWVVRT